MAKYHEVLASLKRHGNYLQDYVTQELVDGLKADGLIDGDGGEIRAAAAEHQRIRTVNAAAADPASAHLIKSLMARARHLGVDIPTDRQIDVRELDRSLAARSVSIEDRVNFKGCLFQMGLIPA